MIKGRKTGYMAAVICLMLLCIVALAGCSNSKYQKIELPETTADSQNTKEESSQGQASETARGAAEAKGLDSGSVPLVQSPTGEGKETAQASTSLLDRDITTSNGFTDVDETVYVICDQVNVRTECAPGAEVVTQLNTGDPVRRTGYSESWSRVVYGDKVCYISSRFLSAEAPVREDKGEEAGQNGSVLVQETQTPPAVPSNGRIVAIDAGHQAKGNSEKEPIGPGSTTLKAKVASGATGAATGLKEYELNLMVSKKLKKILEDRGYQVCMIRETHDVNISNAERADMANNSGASIFVRIHGNSLDNSSVYGALTMCQTPGNPYNGNLHGQSYSLSKKIVDGISGATGTKNRGVQETDTMSGINWCTIPVSIVEMGFMSNPEEDRNLADDGYQDKVAQGIANGIDAYFNEISENPPTSIGGEMNHQKQE